jgi:hypothetical protein
MVQAEWLKYQGSTHGRHKRFFSCTVSTLTLRQTYPPVQWVLGSSPQQVERPGHEADHLLPSSTNVKNMHSYTSTSPHIINVWYLYKHRDNIIFLPQFYTMFCTSLFCSLLYGNCHCISSWKSSSPPLPSPTHLFPTYFRIFSFIFWSFLLFTFCLNAFKFLVHIFDLLRGMQ